MNLNTIFKAQSIVLLINAIGGLFLTTTFLEAANFTVTSDMITFLILSIWSWRLPDIVGESIKSVGMLFAIGGLLWTIIIGYHIAIGAAAGLTAYANIILPAIFALGFYFYSRS